MRFENVALSIIATTPDITLPVALNFLTNSLSKENQLVFEKNSTKIFSTDNATQINLEAQALLVNTLLDKLAKLLPIDSTEAPKPETKFLVKSIHRAAIIKHALQTPYKKTTLITKQAQLLLAFNLAILQENYDTKHTVSQRWQKLWLTARAFTGSFLIAGILNELLDSEKDRSLLSQEAQILNDFFALGDDGTLITLSSKASFKLPDKNPSLYSLFPFIIFALEPVKINKFNDTFFKKWLTELYKLSYEGDFAATIVARYLKLLKTNKVNHGKQSLNFTVIFSAANVYQNSILALNTTQRNLAVSEFYGHLMAYCSYIDKMLIPSFTYNGDIIPHCVHVLHDAKGMHSFMFVPILADKDGFIDITITMRGTSSMNTAIADLEKNGAGSETIIKFFAHLTSTINSVINEIIKCDPTLNNKIRITTAGHSLGGALSQRFMIYLVFAKFIQEARKQNEKLDIKSEHIRLLREKLLNDAKYAPSDFYEHIQFLEHVNQFIESNSRSAGLNKSILQKFIEVLKVLSDAELINFSSIAIKDLSDVISTSGYSIIAAELSEKHQVTAALSKVVTLKNGIMLPRVDKIFYAAINERTKVIAAHCSLVFLAEQYPLEEKAPIIKHNEPPKILSNQHSDQLKMIKQNFGPESRFSSTSEKGASVKGAVRVSAASANSVRVKAKHMNTTLRGALNKKTVKLAPASGKRASAARQKKLFDYEKNEKIALAMILPVTSILRGKPPLYMPTIIPGLRKDKDSETHKSLGAAASSTHNRTLRLPKAASKLVSFSVRAQEKTVSSLANLSPQTKGEDIKKLKHKTQEPSFN